ncbi:uncharacterized protein Z518_00435 [Rhinocladiella mackenziei CBS 650.93]|uniref:Heterokaryon incompatibility domain-containing protein n=1 Tax=Rhinocladiella mackenziei CBS 650.93 TaxID=1442369 RepID=A0A0D2J0Y2_9EURO|nr:uncharacterized protein Z518_00435 [Rhinocladiella mackenziei CBS 650.93]KIX09356.1 hypothetical protein Z518_00435 [Rhinocladiella mackenziei CBS 650.93]
MDSGDKIRILDLLPGGDGDDIHGILRDVGLGDGEQYEALSYVWGDGTNLRTVKVSGRSIEVTETLFAALKRLRNQRATRSLWADQLCINQWDAKDKANQVNMMRDIYRSCTQCLIWLGEIQDTGGIALTDVEGAFDFIRLCAACSEDSQLGIAIPPSLSTPDQLEGAYRAFKTLTLNGHPWWSRIWTVQEVVLPPKVLVRWGPLSLPWSIVAKAASNLCSSRNPAPVSLLKRFYGLINDFTGPVRGLGIARYGESPLDLFQRWRYRDATEPRDKVYALLGLYPNMPLPHVQSCSYEIPTVTLYTKVTIDLIQLQQGLRPLVGLRGKYTPGLPTWVIDLAGAPNMETSYWWWNHSHRYQWFDAGGGEPLRWQILHGGSVLSLTGLSVDTVEEVGEVLRTLPGQYASDKRLVETMKSWEQMVISYVESQHLEHNYHNGDSWANAFWSTMIGDLIMREFPRHRGGAAGRQLVLEFCKNGGWSEVCESLHGMIINQNFFITKRGYIGIGPATTVRGDEVWVLFGAKVPFILRPSTNERRGDEKIPKYTLVGNTFVYGIMDGEVVNLYRELQQEVHIC